MKTLYRYFLESPKTLTLLWLTLAALALNMWASQILTTNYTISKFPVPYYVAQLSFDAEKLKSWYSFLIEHNTLNQYIHTQHIDSLFILSTLLLHTLALVFISRLFLKHSKSRKIMVICALIAAIAPVFDQIENLVSYVMLADPKNFPSALAYIYSSFAATKFVFFVFAYIAASLGLIAGLIAQVKARIRSQQDKYCTSTLVHE
jgi:hypothetical protein